MHLRPLLYAVASLGAAALALASCHQTHSPGGPSRFDGGGHGGQGTNDGGSGNLDGGHCQFPSEFLYSANPQLVAFATGDLNNDGYPEVVAVGGNMMNIWHGQIDGGLGGPDVYSTAGNSVAVQIGNFDNDQFTDVAVVNDIPQSSTQLFQGTGNGTVSAPLLGPGQSFITGVVTADFDRDGFLDLAVSSDNLMNGFVYVLLDPTPTTVPFNHPVAIDSTRRRGGLATGDVTGDGPTDLISTDPVNGQATVYQGQGDGGFVALAPVDAGTDPTAVIAFDVTRDGWVDAVVASTNESALYVLPQANGLLTTGLPVTTVGHPIALAAGDWFSDGRAALATAETTPSALGLYAYDADAGALVSFGFVTPSNFPHQVSVADVTADGNQDLVALLDGGVAIYPAVCP